MATQDARNVFIYIMYIRTGMRKRCRLKKKKLKADTKK